MPFACCKENSNLLFSLEQESNNNEKTTSRDFIFYKVKLTESKCTYVFYFMQGSQRFNNLFYIEILILKIT
ncbi:hypothetical protein CCYN2B_330011 [Capnocytophaga cynodegmi]|uniref:Uncharacterized protein n=1 Tax=Capnocytophaga cynodegmi TaxID=28189 RepID=A0A0B7HAT6_9FLAO|nr:hypothetical protein CCYN2B_330011 [Capnocytophaga cynodegmi]